MENFKVGIIGAGHIARKMAHTLRDMEGVEPYAVASRNFGNAESFAREWGFTRAYGAYEELADDPEELLDLFCCQGRSRLIHDQDLRVDRKCLRDLDHLLLGYRKIADGLSRIDIDL